RKGDINGSSLKALLRSRADFLRLTRVGSCLVTCVFLVLAGCRKYEIVDEAKALGKTPADFPADDYDYFRQMDMRPDGTVDANGNSILKPLELTPDEIKGRNTWVLWCAGDEVFWDYLAGHSYGFMDLLKLCDFAPDDKLGGKRWGPAGLTIEPRTKVPDKPDEFGLYIRQPEDTTARQPDPNVYGRSSGIVGLRLFPNPKFDDKARTRWDAVKYRKDENYYNDPNLVRPYRVGMSCVFCHVAPHPLNPPADPEAPKWENLSTTIGAQYFRMRAVFGNLLKEDNFIYHLLDSQPPGTIDTSLIATDQINNTSTMNALWDFGARLDRSGILAHRSPEYAKDYTARYGHNDFEKVSAESATMPVLLYDLPDAYANPRPVPRILLEGADSIGAWGALARVYLNIGMFSERWITLHNLFIGFRKQQPFKVSDTEKNSVYWQVNKRNVDYLAKFFLKSTGPMRLKDAPGGSQLGNLKGEGVPWDPQLAAGRKVFAERCIICHSSKQPNGMNGAPKGPEKINPHELVEYLKDASYRSWALAEVEKRDFWENNFLSTDLRIPITLIKTNPARSLGSNAIPGHIWEDYSSDTYKNLPVVDKVTCWNPFTQQNVEWQPPGNGRGYYRPPPLVGIWATAPFLHNNTCGFFNNDASVKGRLDAFNDAIYRLLTPGKTDGEAEANRYLWASGPSTDLGLPLNHATLERFKQDHGLIWRTPVETHLHIPASYIQQFIAGVSPEWIRWLVNYPWISFAVLLLIGILVLLRSRKRVLGTIVVVLAVLLGLFAAFLRGWFGDLNVMPTPAGTPVDMLANLDPEQVTIAKPANLIALTYGMKNLKKPGTDAERKQVEKLLRMSTSPDLILDRGHYFAKDLSKQELDDLVDLLKTF
ncbi:MAG TPA: cytochrome c, partial [Candidatus Udaeobacter sp.]|nr:cytochrome c [Candidatus Udaeobacter sp.]